MLEKHPMFRFRKDFSIKLYPTTTKCRSVSKIIQISNNMPLCIKNEPKPPNEMLFCFVYFKIASSFILHHLSAQVRRQLSRNGDTNLLHRRTPRFKSGGLL